MDTSSTKTKMHVRDTCIFVLVYGSLSWIQIGSSVFQKRHIPSHGV